MQCALRCSAAVVALLLPALPAHARAHHTRGWTDSQFAAASQLQESLEASPVEQRTRHDYQRVIDAYRRIYMAAPISPKAEPSVVASAQVMEEMGRRFRDLDILRSAIKQYEFLRREYPGSKFRFDALFRIGEIYKDDLHDKASADATFEEFLRRYPHNQFAQAARSALAEPAQQAARSSKHTTTASSREASKAASPGDSKSSSNDDADDIASDETAQSQAIKNNETKENSAEEESQNEPAKSLTAASGKPSRVLGIRHWSTPQYTRVAIDLEQGVEFESQRIENPDRVFFDLRNTKLDNKLASRNIEVNDGLIKSVRVAQFKAGQSRIVLDLDANSECSASLLANPPRLMIDIRSSDIRSTEGAHRQSDKTSSPAADVASATEPAQDKNPASNKMAGSISDSDALLTPAGSDSKKSPRRVTVVGDNGVKKTIVDADDDDVPAKTPVAKLDPPEIKPVNKVAGTPEPSVQALSRNGKGKRKTPVTDPDTREAQPTASGDRSLIRALGLKLGKIVIDPGHGGHDTGTIGPNGLEEKDLVLDVSRRLGKLLQARLGAEVIYTRKDDTFIPLETRTAIANQESADLFVSVHANSSHDPDARGVETYYLNFTSSPEALEVAARENAVSEKSIHELQDLVKKIALREKIEESHEFASDVQNSLHSGLAAKNPGLRDRGVKKAPNIVLIRAIKPPLLAGISFVSNPGDEHRLQSQDYRQKIAESLYRGIAKYVSGLSGVKVASKIDKDEGQ
jgi:N-acetylmuramoyl-L-alanine amidase